MGVDYDSSGGVGIMLDDRILSKFQEDIDEQYDGIVCEFLDEKLKETSLVHSVCGSEYSGCTENMVLIDAETLVDAWGKADKFVDEFNKVFDADIHIKDIMIIHRKYIS